MPGSSQSDRRKLKDVRAALDAADSYVAWRAAAEEHDQLTGADAWREDDESDFYDASLLRAEIDHLRRLRARPDGQRLAEVLTASVYRHQADLSALELYSHALLGTKHIVGRWLDEVEASLRWLAKNPVTGISPTEKRARFEQAWRVYGRSALMLSGGATWGFIHLGVVKALFENGVLPHILSGASTGAMIAAGICTRNDQELADMFADLDGLRLDGILPLALGKVVEAGALLDSDRLHQVIRHNVGDWTFAEAYAHSRRALNISVSPTRKRQKPQVLSHLTAPDVLVAKAALASSALPGLFPPVMLEARNAVGAHVPYIPSERWVDGSLSEDLPKLRLARLHNVNHFIVSQANPHIVPFARVREHGGVAPGIARFASAAARTQGAYAADVARRVAPSWAGPVRQVADRTYALVSQEYGGDIDITPRFHWNMLGKVVANPTRAELAFFVREGERATWPRLQMIDDQTRLGRVFRQCVAQLRAPAESVAGEGKKTG